MGIPVVESVGTGTREDTSATLTITKPASVAVGDLLVAIIGWRNGVSRSLSTLSGWTALNVSGSDVYGLGSFWRIADAADVAASDYTWSMSGNTSWMSGAILRISGQATGNEINGNESDTASESDTTISFTTAATPVSSSSLIIMAISGISNVNLSAYSTTPSATFTEQADLPLAQLLFGVATAPYSGTTQITSRDFTTSGSVTTPQISVFLFVNGVVDASGTNALLSADADFFAPAASSGTSGTAALLSADADHFAVSGRGDRMGAVVNTTKPALGDVVNTEKYV